MRLKETKVNMEELEEFLQLFDEFNGKIENKHEDEINPILDELEEELSDQLDKPLASIIKHYIGSVPPPGVKREFKQNLISTLEGLSDRYGTEARAALAGLHSIVSKYNNNIE